MIPIGRLKSNLQFNKNLGDLVEVMKLASTSQFNQFRNRQEPSEEFIRLLDEVFAVLLSTGLKSELLTAKENLPSLYLLVSSDEGFLGELNFLLVNKLLNARNTNDIIAVCGQQGSNYLKELQINFDYFDSPGEKIEVQSLSKIREHLFGKYLDRKVGRVYVVYSRFISLTSQQVELDILLPLAAKPAAISASMMNLLIEPNFESVIEGWIKSWLDFSLFSIIWSAKLAELAARIMHLEGSVQELGKINMHMRMEYFKYLHSLSDKLIRELSAARLIRRDN